MPRLPAKVSQVHGSQKGKLELTNGGGNKTQKKLPLVQEAMEEEGEGMDDEESGEVIRSEADILLEDIEQRKIARRNREIQDKLDAINERISKTLGSYELMEGEEAEMGRGGGDMQFVRDMNELMEIATDAVKKRKYMKEVSVFIVGFSTACEQRLGLLEQLEVFFQEQEKQPEIDHKMTETDLDSIAQSISEAIDFAEGSMGKLGDLNKEIITAVENAVTARERARGNQRMKKQLDKAKEDIQALSDKLLEAQTELEEKAKEMKLLQRQNEELKIHAERAKKLAEDLKEKSREVDTLKDELRNLQEELNGKEAIIEGLNREIDRIEAEKIQIREELHSVIAVKQETIESLEEQIREMEIQHSRAMEDLRAQHEEQMEDLKRQFEQQLEEERETMALKTGNLQNELDETKQQFEQLQKEAKSLSEELDMLKNRKIYTEDEIGPPFDIHDEESWSNVADDELRARYNQYRKLAMSHITQLEEKVENSKNLEKQLSEKFYEMEKQWNAERQLLLEQAERAEQARQQAEQEAEQSLLQLETFLDDVEKLHKMRDYTRLEARHYRKLDEDMQQQYLKTLSPYAKEALMKQLEDSPADVNFAVQTEEVIKEAKKAISDIRAGSRRTQRSAEAQMRVDPMLSEYLRTYDFVHEFKSTIAFLFKNKSVDSLVTILDEIEMISFDKDENCFQQIAEMQQQLIILLGEILAILLRILYQNKLDHSTLIYFHKHLPDLAPRSLYAIIDDSILAGGAELKRLQQEFANLKAQTDAQKRIYEDKIHHLEDENSQLKEKIHQLMSRLEGSENKLAHFEAQRSAILFTRIDAERNHKNLKKAIQYNKIDTETFEKATELIDKYTSLPGQRLLIMVKRYTAHCSMQLLEENIRRMASNKGAHIQLIHNFEKFQQKREAQWRAVSVGLAAKRQETAQKLTEDLEAIENNSHGSIFLIKPMFAYRAKMNQYKRGAGAAMELDLTEMSDHKSPTVPHPNVLATNQPQKKRLLSIHPKVLAPQFIPGDKTSRPFLPMTNLFDAESGYVDNEMTGAALLAQDPFEPTWNKTKALVTKDENEDTMLTVSQSWNTPKLLELDINRFLMDHNNIASNVRATGNRSNRGIGTLAPRSYLTVSRTIPAQDALIQRQRHLMDTESLKDPEGTELRKLPPISS